MAVPPPFTMQTRGRNNIRAPKKYEGMVADDEPEEELYRPTVAQRKSVASGYRGKVIEFNPNLPPAAFPTIELGQRKQSNSAMGRDRGMRSAPMEQTNRNEPCEMHRPAYSTPNTATFNKLTLQDPKVGSSAIHNSRLEDVFQEFRHTQETTEAMESSAFLRATSVTPQRENTMNIQRPTVRDDWWERTNDFDNPVYAENMKTMERLGARTEMEQHIAEMDTSGEDELPAVSMASRNMRQCRSPESLANLWEELPVALKVDLVDTMDEVYPNGSEAMQRLHLNGLQREEILNLLSKKNNHAAAEDEAAASLRQETTRILLSRSGEELKRVTQTGFRHLLQDGLYKSTGEEDYHTATRAEVAKAREYLGCCGQNPRLLDHWASAVGSKLISTAPNTLKNTDKQENPIQRVLNGAQASLGISSSRKPSPLQMVTTIDSGISVQPSLQVPLLDSPQCADNMSSASQRSLPPSLLPKPLGLSNMSSSTLRHNVVSQVPRASDIQTPLPTPDALLPIPVTGRASSDQRPGEYATAGGNNDGEPPPKKRFISSSILQNVAPSLTGSTDNKPISIRVATTKSTRKKATFLPTITPEASPFTQAVPFTTPVSTNPTGDDNTTMDKSMPAPPAPASSGVTSMSIKTILNQTPTPTSPLPSFNVTRPPAKVSGNRRRKTIAPALSVDNVPSEPGPKTVASNASVSKAPASATTTASASSSAPASAPAPKNPRTRRKTATPITPKASGKEVGKFAPGTKGNGGRKGG